MKQVRWILQASRDGANAWVDRPDLVYPGWFDYSEANPEPSPAVLEAFDEAVATEPHLDFRLLQEIRSHQSDVIKAVTRGVPVDSDLIHVDPT